MPRVSYPLAVTGTTLADGTQGQSYRDVVVAEGGRPRYRYAIQQGSLPRGLRLYARTGAITGTPKASGTYTVTIEVTDSTTPAPLRAIQTLSLDVAPPPALR
jgi:hypothetical protein